MPTSTSLLPSVVTPDSFQKWTFSAELRRYFLSLPNIHLFDIYVLAKSIFLYHLIHDNIFEF